MHCGQLEDGEMWMEVEQSPSGWQPLGQGTLNERIRSEILRVLAARELSPGDRLPSERELAATLRVSRPSVRERHGHGGPDAAPVRQPHLRADARQRRALQPPVGA